MSVLGLGPSGRLGPSPGRRRPLAPPFSPDQLTGPDFRYEAGNPQSTVTSGAVQPAAGSYATPAAMVLGADHDPAPFDHAEADALTVTAATKLLSTAAQQQLVGWAGAKWDS